MVALGRGVAALLAIGFFVFNTSNDPNTDTPILSDTENTNVNDNSNGVGGDTIWDDKKDDRSNGQKGAFPITEESDAVVDGPAKSANDAENRHPQRTQVATSAHDGHNSGVSRTERGVLKKIYNAGFDKKEVQFRTSKNSETPADRDGLTNREKNDGMATNRMTTTKAEMPRDARTPSNILGESVDAIAQTDETKKNDLANNAVIENPKKSILEAIDEPNEEDDVAEISGSRWSAGPNVAPVYFDALGEGSPIDPGFSANAKSGSTNMSYGISVTYAVTKKLSVRTGIHKAEYGYQTGDVGLSPTLSATTAGRLQNIDYAEGADSYVVSNSFSDAASPDSFAPEFNSLNATRDGEVLQEFGYLEVPFELDYALLDSRFGIHLVGGVSSLFLTNNSVTLSSGELTTEIGEARNLNDVNFSTNIGFGINYRFTPKIQLNVEPVFKYQLNTFSNVSGDFRPYSIGVYSGVNFSF